MARTVAYALRITEEDSALLEALASKRLNWYRMPQKPSEYLRRVIERHLRRVRRNMERKQADAREA
jgi:hypothetical protein